MAILKRRVKRDSAGTNARNSTSSSEILLSVKEAGISTTPLNLREVVKFYGIKLRAMPLENDVSGHLSKQNNDWVIVVNSLHHPRRQRFTVAHELAHYFLHRHQQDSFVDKKLFRNGDSNPMETEANRFAASLLMPEKEFREFVKSKSKKVEDIAENFGVSSMAVRIRAKELGFMGHNV